MSQFFNTNNAYSFWSRDAAAIPDALKKNANFTEANKNASEMEGQGPFFEQRPAVKEALSHVVNALMEKVNPVSGKGFIAPAA